MSIIKSAKAKTLATVAGLSAMVISVPARADWMADATSGINTAFSNAQSIAGVVVVGFAAIFGIKLVKRLFN